MGLADLINGGDYWFTLFYPIYHCVSRWSSVKRKTQTKRGIITVKKPQTHQSLSMHYIMKDHFPLLCSVTWLVLASDLFFFSARKTPTWPVWKYPGESEASGVLQEENPPPSHS